MPAPAFFTGGTPYVTTNRYTRLFQLEIYDVTDIYLCMYLTT